MQNRRRASQKTSRNRGSGVSAPRLGQTRCGERGNSVAEVGEGVGEGGSRLGVNEESKNQEKEVLDFCLRGGVVYWSIRTLVEVCKKSPRFEKLRV